jgi:hypothetical protein
MYRFSAFGSFPMGPIIALAFAGSLVGWSSSARAVNAFSLVSSPQSWIGAGNPVRVTQDDGFSFVGYLDSGSAVSFSINDFDGRSGRAVASWWLVELAAPSNRPLAVGLYRNAQHYPYQRSAFPGINFEGNGRTNSYVTGSFEILELVARPDGTILSFAADFIQFDEDIADWWNKGSLRFNSNRPLSFLALPSVDPPVTPSPTDPVLLDPPPVVGQNPIGGTIGQPPPDPSTDEPPLIGSPGAPDPVPGPLPVAAGLAGWRVSRHLRRRCQHKP